MLLILPYTQKIRLNVLEMFKVGGKVLHTTLLCFTVIPYINFVMLQFQDVMFPDFEKLC